MPEESYLICGTLVWLSWLTKRTVKKYWWLPKSEWFLAFILLWNSGLNLEPETSKHPAKLDQTESFVCWLLGQKGSHHHGVVEHVRRTTVCTLCIQYLACRIYAEFAVVKLPLGIGWNAFPLQKLLPIMCWIWAVPFIIQTVVLAHKLLACLAFLLSFTNEYCLWLNW